MCGISGVVLREGEVAQTALLKKMSDAMVRRGPDGEGQYAFQNYGLSHRRLRIIDLSEAGSQPMFSNDRKISIVFNGEIYNFQELKSELANLGHEFKSRSDTEVILHAFEEWGEAAFRRLNGMFAFGLLDQRGMEPALYLVRDRFGVKPLFYAHNEGRLAFASELKPILTLPWISKEIESDTLFYFLKFSHVPGDRSILKHIQQLAPGYFLKYQSGNAVFTRFWDPSELRHETVESQDKTEEEWCNELEEVLGKAVERQLVSDVPVGCFLSGGIDSSLLVMAHSRLGRPPLKTFTISYNEAEFNEAPYAAEVARAFGADHHDWVAEPHDFIGMIPDIPTYFDQPFADPTLLASLLLARFARQEVTVALSGDGGDELFFGYPYQNALLRSEPLLKLPEGMRRSGFAVAENLPLMSHRARKAAEIFQFKDEAEFFQYFVGTIGPMRLDRLARLLKNPPLLTPALFKGVLDDIGDVSWREKIEQIFIRTFLVDTVLTKTDRTGMAFGLEARVPFLDDEMAEFSSRLPFDLKLRKGQSKYLLRKLLARNLPGELSQRKKQGFSIPLRDWLRGELKYLLDEYLNSFRIKKEGLFSPEEIHALVKSHLSGKFNHSHLLWSLISFQMWKESYLP